MKRNTPEHPKVLELAARLFIPRYAAVGLLELLWHFTARYAIAGDVGRWSNARIADALHWRPPDPAAPDEIGGTPEQLIDALRASGWLDDCPTHRLVVHDWADHADEAVKKTLKNRGLSFVSGKGPNDSGNVRNDSGNVLTFSSLPVPMPEPKPEPKPKSKTNGHAGRVPAGVFQEFWQAYPRKQARRDAEKAWRQLKPDAALLAVIVADVTARAREDPQWRAGYIPHPATYLRGRRWEDERPLSLSERARRAEQESPL